MTNPVQITPPVIQSFGHVDIEMGATTPGQVVAEHRLNTVTAIDTVLTIAAAGLGLTVGAIQLANRGDSLDTGAERVAAATVALCSSHIVSAGMHFRDTALYKDDISCTYETVYEIFKLAALGLGACSSGFVVADTATTSAGPAHEAVAKATLALIGASVVLSLVRCCAWANYAHTR